jgi:hypothetical protein
MPNYSKTILCLANSRKISGRCIAGREIIDGKFGPWVRPVSAREHGELSEDDRRFENGSYPRVLDFVQIPMIEARPNTFQTENHLIDPNYYWTHKGRAAWDLARTAAEMAKRPLWSNQSSSYNGLHDRVDETTALPADGSLLLIEVTDLCVNVVLEGTAFGDGKRKVRGRFTLHGVEYCLAITDPSFERQYLERHNGMFNVGHALLCISLGEAYQGFAYKLIAAVLLKQS